MSWYFKKQGVSGGYSQPDNVLAFMTMALEHETLRHEPLFANLETRLA